MKCNQMSVGMYLDTQRRNFDFQEKMVVVACGFGWAVLRDSNDRFFLAEDENDLNLFIESEKTA